MYEKVLSHKLRTVLAKMFQNPPKKPFEHECVMNELPVIVYSCLCKELWDRRGVNIASCLKEN